MSKASDKRYAGIAAVNEATNWPETFLGQDGEFFQAFIWTRESRSEIASRIRELASLGRTDRWTRAVEDWATMVEDTSTDLFHSFHQWQVFAAHAAE